MDDKTIALVTGANKGLGYAVAEALGALGHTVVVGARDDGRRDAAVSRLEASGVDAVGVPLDVTDSASVAAAVRWVEDRLGGLDVLVNNAGIAGPFPQEPTALTPEVIRDVVDTNVAGVVRTTNTALPLLRRSAHPRIVNVTSHVGSLTLQSDPDVDLGPLMAAYAPAKTFLNALTLMYARELRDTGVLVNGGAPGYVATDFNGFQGTTSPGDAARVLVRLATLPDDGPSGTVVDIDGPVPW